MPHSDDNNQKYVPNLEVTLPGLQDPVLAIFDGGAEVSIISYDLYTSLDPLIRPKLLPSQNRIRGMWSESHIPVGEVILPVKIPDLHVTVEYRFAVEMEVDVPLLLDSSFMAYAGISNNFEHHELRRKGLSAKAARRVTRVVTCRRITLAENWILPPHSRSLLPGSVKDHKILEEEQDAVWLVEPPRSLPPERPVLIARTLCNTDQVGRRFPVEIYNPSSEPVQLFFQTTIGLLSQVELAPGVDPIDVVEGHTPVTVRRTEEVHPSDGGTTKTSLPPELEDMIGRCGECLDPVNKKLFVELVERLRRVFSIKGEPLGRTTVTLHDVDTGDARPIKCRARRTPLGLRDEAMKEEAKMRETGVIEPSESPWASPVVLVRKKDGSLRYCIDYRQLNKVTKKDSYPLPNMQDCLDSLGKAKYFSTMDLSSGYWQVGNTEEAKLKSAFYGVGGGLWQFKVMPFGLCNAPATFERLMERVLGQLQWQICLCYIDDILVYSTTISEHLERLETVLSRLDQAHLKLKPKKCHFFQSKVTFLGHVVSADGISTDPAKIDKVVNCPNPTNIHEVRSMVGFMSYYRRFIPHFSELAKPLVTLTEKDKRFSWGPDQEKSVVALKEALCSAPVLAYPLPDEPFILDTDASDVGIGAVLSQIQNGEERVIAYGSRSLTKAEKNYCVTRREMLAVVYFTDYYRHFLLGHPFRVRTDNSAVRYMNSMTYKPVGQIARWLEKLQSFDFMTEHRPGRQHSNADGLSRPPFVRCSDCSLEHAGAKLSKRDHPTKTPEISPTMIEKVRITHNDRDAKPDHSQPLRNCGPETAHTSQGQGPVRQSPRGGSSFKEGRGDKEGSSNNKTDPKSRRRVGGVQARLRRPRGGAARAASSWLSGGVTLDKGLVETEQMKDPAAVDARIWIQSGKKPSRAEIMSLSLDHKFLWTNFDVLAVEDGLLVVHIKPRLCGPEKVNVYIPSSLRRRVISLCHDNITSGHFYFWKTLNLVKRYFLWPRMRQDIQLYCKQCHVCATKKQAGNPQRASMQRYDAGLPMEEICIDLKGPYPESDRGNKYVLVVVDSFTKWMEAYPIPNAEAKTVAEKLVMEFISRFGVPFWIKSDQGRQFQSEVFEKICELLGVEHRTSTAFHPQGNSRAERMVKVVGNLLSAFCTSQKTWDDNLPLMTLAYRSTLHEVTGFSPNYMTFGREVYLPLDLMIGSLPEAQRDAAPEYIGKLKERLESCFQAVRSHLKDYGERQRKYYNLKKRGEDFKIGQLVYAMEKTRKIGVSPKLSPRWKGPYLVIQKCGGVYEVQVNSRSSKLLHFDLLKPCYSDTFPGWIKRAKAKLCTT